MKIPSNKIKDNTTIYVDESYSEDVEKIAKEVQNTGIKSTVIAESVHRSRISSVK